MSFNMFWYDVTFFLLFSELSKENPTNMYHMAVCQNLVPLVNIKIAGKWMFIPLKMVLIGIDPYPYHHLHIYLRENYSVNCPFWSTVGFLSNSIRGGSGKEQPKRRRTSACTWGYASLPGRPHIGGESPIWMGLVSQGGAPPVMFVLL